VFTTDFPLDLPDPRLMALGAVMMRHLDAFTQARVATAERLIDGLTGHRSLRTITVRSGAQPVYLRLPVLFSTTAERQAALDALNAAGVGATGTYPAAQADEDGHPPQPLADVDGLKPLLADRDARVPGARSVAQRIATLPTHPYVTADDTGRIVATLAQGMNAACAA
jgi:dTDP-4-amino-4,6-dideoxygalactose transaminase